MSDESERAMVAALLGEARAVAKDIAEAAVAYDLGGSAALRRLYMQVTAPPPPELVGPPRVRHMGVPLMVVMVARVRGTVLPPPMGPALEGA